MKAAGSVGSVPFGFDPASFKAERQWENDLLRLPDPKQCGRFLRQLTSIPHVAGSAGDHQVTRWIFDEFKRDGLNPQIVEYKVLLSYPRRIDVDLVSPVRVELAHPEPPIQGDPDTQVTDPLYRMPWNAYSPSADFTAPVIYANYGNASDYAVLAKAGISVKGRVVLVRYFHGYRGGKSLEAERHGVAGLIVYSDPADDGSKQGPVYPDGPWGPPGHFQRGSVVYDFMVPGDPLTPGWASTDSARRIPQSASKILPKIPMVPLSAADARAILRRLAGPGVPAGWQGGLPFNYHMGDGSTRVHLALKMEDKVTPIWDVIGTISGNEEPEKQVVLGNHHDAWVYGAVDPSSGTASMLELARAFGRLLQQGFRPRRTIVLASWDAEEYTLTGSTEWGEEHEAALRKNGVVCLNVDSATSGSIFTVGMVPSLLRAVADAAKDVRDPKTGHSIYTAWSRQKPSANVRSYAAPGSKLGALPFGLLGGGSDFMVFLQHDGVPSLDMIFDGPYGVYHSVYDDFRWMSRYGDPGFRYHATMSRLWGLIALRFADADVLPFDESAYAAEVASYLQGLRSIAPPDFYQQQIEPLLKKDGEWQAAGKSVDDEIDRAASGGAFPASFVACNRALMAEERAWLDQQGIPGRPWFRHLVYAPLESYEAETVPGLREALLAHDFSRAGAQAVKINAALDRAIQTLLP
ncbi:MAG: M28 family metallopeptidase, partial [Terriglobia bacterium]